MSGRFKPPDFCGNCSRPFPWLSRQGLIYQLENMLDSETLDPAARLEAMEQLEALALPEVDEAEQLRRWRRVQALAPGLLESGRRILENVVSAEIRRELGL